MRLICFLSFCFLTKIAAAQSAAPGAPPCADAAERPVLLVFSGSDWCQPCIRFEKQVLSDSAFQNYASAHLNIIKADFPQRKKLLPAQRRENEQLAERYNPEGKFPHLVLLRADRTVLAVLASDAENGVAFIAQLKKYFSEK